MAPGLLKGTSGNDRLMDYLGRKLRKRRRQARSDHGGALIEMALMTPLLLLLVLGVGDFGRIMFHGITLTNAARAGAAFGSQGLGNLADTAGIRLAAEQEAQNIGPITVTSQRICECTSGTAVSCTVANCSGYGAPMAFVEVTRDHDVYAAECLVSRDSGFVTHDARGQGAGSMKMGRTKRS